MRRRREAPSPSGSILNPPRIGDRMWRAAGALPSGGTFTLWVVIAIEKVRGRDVVGFAALERERLEAKWRGMAC